jgi:hypothetical protein
MGEETSTILREERRKEPRDKAETFYSVEIFIPAITKRYQFKLRNISENGLSILVKNDSLILDHLDIGDTLHMLYHPLRGAVRPEELNTRIRHVTKCESGRYHGHVIVGLQIMEKAE